MPRRTGAKTGFKRRKPLGRGLVVRKRRKVGILRNSLSRAFTTFNGNSPFPPNKLYKLKYTESFVFSTDSTPLRVYGTQQRWNLNSLFDPDSTGTGHQPYGFDALAIAYNRYKVVGVTVEMEVTDPSADGIRIGACLLNPANAGGTISGVDPDVVAERNQGYFFDINNSGRQVEKRRFFVPMYKVAGVTKLQFNADPDNYTAPVNGNPGSLCQLCIAAVDMRAASMKTVMITTTLTYHAMFYQRKIMAQS